MGTLYATGNLPGQKPTNAPAASDQGAATHSQPAAALIYVSLDPPFTMSFQDSSVAQYLQFAINVAVEDKARGGRRSRHMIPRSATDW